MMIRRVFSRKQDNHLLPNYRNKLSITLSSQFQTQEKQPNFRVQVYLAFICGVCVVIMSQFKKNSEVFKPPSASTSTTLSKSVLGMKFMKRKEEAKVNEEKAIEKYNQINNDSNWVTNSEPNIMEVEHSNDNEVLTCVKDDGDLYSSLPGRRSFGGFNKAVEAHYQQMINRDRFETKAKIKNEVTDEEMFQRYETLVGLPRGPNQGKRQEHKPFVSNSAPNVHATVYNKKSSDFNNGGGKSGDVSISMEEIQPFEDRQGFKRKPNNNGSHGQHQNKKKFKR